MHNNKTNKTLKKRKVKKVVPDSLTNFHKEITIKFLEALNTVKLYHWKTKSYATHKATDELYAKLNTNIDMFIEILLGKTESRIDLSCCKTLHLNDLKTEDEMKKYIKNFKNYLLTLNDNKGMKLMANNDLYNIRDEMLADLNQYLYLATLS
jgi:Family of unknown function (DUF5856)